MRQFLDDDGHRWAVTVGKQSYGALVLLFDRRAAVEVRECAIEAQSRFAAERELAALDDMQLRTRLRASRPWGDPEG